MNPAIAPARHSSGFLRVFGWYACRLLRRRFASVRIADETDAIMRETTESGRPVLIAMNHPSWWDPIIGVMIKQRYLRERFAISPIDLAMYNRFGFMKRLGLFGIDLDHPNAGPALLDYVRTCAASHPDLAILMTPQGEFRDVRAPIAIRPGIASVALTLENAALLSLSIELTFWHDQRPELLLRFERCEQPAHETTTGYVRVIRDCMMRNADRLAELSIARDVQNLRPLLTPKGPKVNPAYDLIQNVRGRSAEVTPRRERGSEAAP